MSKELNVNLTDLQCTRLAFIANELGFDIEDDEDATYILQKLVDVRLNETPTDPWTKIVEGDASTLPDIPGKQIGIYILSCSVDFKPELHWVSKNYNVRKYLQANKIKIWQPITLPKGK
jgi:hypothetical protein